MEENDEFSDHPNNPNATRNRIVERIVKEPLVLSPDGERVRVRGCHSELDSESHSWAD